MPTVNWGTSALSFAGVQRVYVKQRWADSWTLQSTLWCAECVWNLLPSMPTAQLVRYYGTGHEHGATTNTVRTKLELRGYYVRIEFDCADGTLSWYGFVDEQVDEQGGAGTGRQVFICYSMAKMMDHVLMTYAKWYDEPNTTLRTTGSSIPFNQRGLPNRTDAVKSGVDSHVFYPRMPENILFPKPWQNAAYWSSRDIVDYIENYLAPLDADGNNLIPIRFDNTTIIPNWDRPTIQTEGRTVLSLLNQLINPSRLMQMSIRLDDTTTPDTVVFNLHSLSSTSLTLESGTHPANSDPLTIVASAAQDTNVTVRSSATRLCQQVVVKGAKRETCLTEQVANNVDTTAWAFAEGWTSTQETAYETAASGEAGYGALTQTDKEKLNNIARSSHELDDVFRTFVLQSDWDRQVVSAPGGDRFVFQQDNPAYDAGTPGSQPYIEYHPFWNGIEIKQMLPFKEGYDYTAATAPADADDAEAQYRMPYVLFKNPDEANEWLQAEKMSNGINPTFSVGVGITKEGLGLRLDVLGTYQHSIANNAFNPLPADPAIVGEWDYYDGGVIMTVSLEEDRYAEGRVPADADLSTSFDQVRQKVIYAGEAYRQVRVLTGTCVDVTAAGARRNTVGGLTDSSEHLVNDSDKLASIAEIAAAWYTVDRKVLTLVSARPSATPAVGQLLVTSDGETINTVVSQISISSPLGEGGVGSISYQLQTALGEVDPLQFVPQIARVNT